MSNSDKELEAWLQNINDNFSKMQFLSDPTNKRADFIKKERKIIKLKASCEYVHPSYIEETTLDLANKLTR